MGLAQLTGATKRRDVRERCGTAAWLETLDDDQRAGFAYAVEHNFTAREIFDEAAGDGFPLQYNSMLIHLNGRCSCGTR